MGKTKSVKPTRAQKKIISKAGKDPNDYRVLSDTYYVLTLVRRGDGAVFNIVKGR